MVNLGLSQGMDNTDSPGVLSTAEAATIQLEFRYLTFLSENDEYWDRAENVCPFVFLGAMLRMSSLIGHQSYQGSEVTLRLSSNIPRVSHYLYTRCTTPPFIYVVRAQSGQFLMSPIRLGSRGDSYYEYLLYVFRIGFRPLLLTLYIQKTVSPDRKSNSHVA